ncbi:MAG TPA: sigma-70 family RNA polymerase sigma factor [Bryobacteraceae bacterium]|nr:sigma-70 family RNA polymerase sigma factor [Bryobacteraceae bacterium]
MAHEVDNIAGSHHGLAVSADAGVSPFGATVDWAQLVSRIQAGDQAAMEELYRLFSRGIRFYLCRQLGAQELDDKVHDTFLIVVNAIKRGDLREPERLMGFVRTIVRRQVAAHIDEAVQLRREHTDIEADGITLVDVKRNPEERAIGQEEEQLMTSVLQSMSGRDREILTRFYLNEQSQDQICHDMKISETQFRLLKSRAKARFGELGKKKLQKKPAGSFLMRTLAGSRHYLLDNKKA